MPKADLNILSGYLKKNFKNVSEDFGYDGVTKIAYDGPNLSKSNDQPGVIGSLVDKHGSVIYLYTGMENYPHYTISDNNPHYTDALGNHSTIKNENVLTFLINNGGYKVGGSKKKRKTRRRKLKRKTNKRRTNKRKTNKRKTNKRKTNKRK